MQRTDNLLLAALPVGDRAAIDTLLEPVELVRGVTLIAPGETIRHIWFPSNGIVSIIAESPEAHSAEVGVVGRDGLVGISMLLGADRSPLHAIVQIDGVGHCIVARQLAALCRSQPEIHRLLLRYVQSFLVQASYTALSYANHSVEARLARWLLMCHDRHGDPALPLTHEFLSIMLAVRRPSVTTALHVLEGKGLIHATRGRIVVRDRDGLEAFAGEAYGVPEAEYARLFALVSL